MIDLEQIIDEITNRLKNGRDISLWQNNQQFSPIVNILTKLSNLPKTKIPVANFTRIKNQILDRISLPNQFQTTPAPRGFFASIPYMLKMTSGVVGTLLIVVSLGIGTAVAALQSVPGHPIYPLKKIVENIELKLTRDQTAKANLQIKFANNRLDEITQVIEQSQAGEISSEKAQQIVSKTVSDLAKTTASLNSTTATKDKPKVSTLTKLVDLSNKQAAVLQPLLSAATISNEGEVKIILEKALETSLISKEQAIKNIENAGLKVEETISSNQIKANGKVSAINSDSISVGSAKFLVTKDTEYVNIKSTDLKVDSEVQIVGEVGKDKKTYALKISAPAAKSTPETNTDTKNSTTDTQSQPGTSDTP